MITTLFRTFFRHQHRQLQAREATEKDLSMVRELLLAEACNGHFFGLESPAETDSYVNQLRASLIDYKAGRQIDVFLQMLTLGRKRVGFAILRACPDPSQLELHMLIIAPAYRCQGHASTVIQWFVNDLTKSNRRVLVRCLPASTAMINLLSRHGFQEKDSLDVYVRHFLSPPATQRK